MKLYWVQLEIGIDAKNREDAFNKVAKILSYYENIDFNYSLHDALECENFKTLSVLWEKQDKEKK